METAVLAATLLWSFKAGAPADAAPAVADGRVYLAASDRSLYMLDAGGGKKKASRSFKAPLPASPLVEGDLVFLYVPFPDGSIYALNAADLKKVWRAKAGPGLMRPAVAGGVVAAGRGKDLVFYRGEDGRELGRVGFHAAVVGVSFTGPGTAAAYTSSGELALCTVGVSAPAWRVNLGPGPVYVAGGEGNAYAANGDGIVSCYEGAAGTELWRAKGPAAPVAPPLLWDKYIAVMGVRTVGVYDRATGGLVWEYAAPANVVGGAPCGDGLVVATDTGLVLFVRDGRSQELAQVEKYAACPPTVADGRLYIGDGGKRLKCYNLR